MGGRTIRVLSGISLVLMGITLALWMYFAVGSKWMTVVLVTESRHPHELAYTASWIDLEDAPGIVILRYVAPWPNGAEPARSDPRMWHFEFNRRRPHSNYALSFQHRWLGVPGRAWTREGLFAFGGVSYPWLAGLFGMLPTFRLLARMAKCPRAGYCADCGYDLRSTPGRCPECGRAAEAAQPAAQDI